jgi:hypothetical protein
MTRLMMQALPVDTNAAVALAISLICKLMQMEEFGLL